MAVLTKKEILDLISRGEIGFSPNLDKFQIQDHAVDLRLGFTFLVPKIWHITKRGREPVDVLHFNKKNAEFFDVVELEEGQYFELLPHEHILISTLEAVKVSNHLMGVLYPRSSVNRKGLSLDLTGIVDSGYEGQLTLPMRNNTHSQVVRLYPGERICQVVFEELVGKIKSPKKSKYHKRDIIEGIGKEKRSEATFILKGNIKNLKKDYRVG